MSRRIKRPFSKPRTGDERSRDDRKNSRSKADRPKADRFKDDRSKDTRGKRAPGERLSGHRPTGKPARFSAPRGVKPPPVIVDPPKAVAEPLPLPTKVQTLEVTPDENNMRVDRFLEARF